MPVLFDSDYRVPFLFQNKHLQTIYPALFRRVPGVEYTRERVELPDGDFLDLDWSKRGNQRLVVVLHGLEGNADRPYIRGMVKLFNQAGWDALGWNFRGCSGEINRLLRTYHSGETEDLHWVLSRIIAQKTYESIAIIGFSLGGNVTLKYLGEQGSNLPQTVKAAVAFSVPCDLASSGVRLRQWYNRPYMDRFMEGLKEKIKAKEALATGVVDLDQVYRSRNFADFDGAFTAPVHGFSSAEDYWEKASSLYFLPEIKIPCLLINAQNDSFLSPACFPYQIAKENTFFYLETPSNGGHVGFISRDSEGFYWSERRALQFLEEFGA